MTLAARSVPGWSGPDGQNNEIHHSGENALRIGTKWRDSRPPHLLRRFRVPPEQSQHLVSISHETGLQGH